ncbi:MAG: ABC transporter ATP-binding protein [Acidobacteriota bacterium]
MTPVVELDGLSVTLGRRAILRDLTGTLAGRSIGLLGPNGAGKTTLIHTLLGFHAPSSGTACVMGRDIRRSIGAVRAAVGYMPENDAFITGMSGVRFVTLMAELAGLPPSNALERAHEALYYVGLGEARYRNLETYSLGMRQLAKLAQAIVHGPELLFLDEPTNGLDPPARARMIRLIRQIQESAGVRVILSSHLLRDVEECCEEVLILRDGRIATYCNLEAERQSNKKLLEIEMRGNEEAFLSEAKALGCEWAPGPRRSTKLVLAPELEVRDLFCIAERHDVQIRRLSSKRDSLEEIFLKAMGEIPGGKG